jgi:uncharacterized RDD family membrane protein YckC
VRFVGSVLAALPLFAGYLMIPFDARRRGLNDRLARTVVIDTPQLSRIELRRQRLRILSLRAPETLVSADSSDSDDDQPRVLNQA